MSISVEIEAVGDTKAARDLALVGARAADVLPVYPELDALFREDEARRFELHGPGWAALADQTLQNKALLGQSSDLMRATDALHRSLTTAAGVEPLGLGGSLRFGTDVEYARFHQYGTVKMVKRAVVGVSHSTRRAMVRVVSTYIAEGLP